MQKMAEARAVTETCSQAAVEVTRASVQAIAAARAETGAGPRNEAACIGPRLDGPTSKKPNFDWSATDKYTELRNLRL